MIECIGILEKKGSFENDRGKLIEYDNVMVYFVTNDNPEVTGFYGKEMKVSRQKVQTINFRDWSELIGKQISFEYNMFGTSPTLSGVKIVGDGVVTKFMGEIKRT